MTKEIETLPINESEIEDILKKTVDSEDAQIRDILEKAKLLKGLNQEQVAVLMTIDSPELSEELFHTARYVKETIYGKRLVLFAPLYISNYCCNDCVYCAFRTSNRDIVRRALSQDEIANETKFLVRQGHKRVLLVTGEAYPDGDIGYVVDAIKTIYDTKEANSEIRRLNVNIAPLTLTEFKVIKQANIGTYQLFQETYHRDTYKKVHPKGKKHDYDWRLSGMDRAMEAGIDDVGIGVLFGLYDWRFEVLALLKHSENLDSKYGVGPHTISIPRLEPALGSDFTAHPPYKVSDENFLKLVAILRLAVPYTGMIMSTREVPNLRRHTFELGISQISAGSRTNPGGYAEGPFEGVSSQFQLGDHRSLDDVIKDVASHGFIPSFCTACYRLGRTGMDFMDLAKPGDIKKHCDPNALSTFLEYLIDYGSEETHRIGEDLINTHLEQMDEHPRKALEKMLERVREGKRDVFC